MICSNVLDPILALMITNCFQNFNSNGIVNILCMSLYSKNKMSMYRFFCHFSPTFSPYKTNLRPYYILLFVLVKKWWLVINQFLCFSVLLVFYYYYSVYFYEYLQVIISHRKCNQWITKSLVFLAFILPNFGCMPQNFYP